MPEHAIALIARYDDPHVRLFQRAALHQGVELRCLLLGRSGEEYNFYGDLKSLHVEFDNYLFGPTQESQTVLYLPFSVNNPPHVHDATSQFSNREWQATFDAFIRLWYRTDPQRWMVKPSGGSLQNQRIDLLCLAAHLFQHIRVPRTVFGNDASIVGRSSEKWVGKAINAWEEVGPDRYFATTLIGEHLASKLSTRLSTPALVQEYIKHSEELRVYMLPRSNFVGVSLRVDGEAPIDFRLGGGTGFRATELLELPQPVVDDLRALMDRVGLNYCVFDLGLVGGSHVLFDVNPTGSWAYLNESFSIDLTVDILRAAAGE